jgi:hypothetical protein
VLILTIGLILSVASLFLAIPAILLGRLFAALALRVMALLNR